MKSVSRFESALKHFEIRKFSYERVGNGFESVKLGLSFRVEFRRGREFVDEIKQNTHAEQCCRRAAENGEHFSARYTVAESADYFLVRERFVRKEFFHQIVVRFRNGFDKQLTKHIYFFLQRRGNVYNLNFVVDYSLSFHLNDVNVARNFFVLNDGNGYGANALTVSLFERVEHAVEVAVFFIYARDKEKLGHIQAFCKVYCLGRSEVYTAFCGNDNKRRLCHSDSLKNFALKIEITRSVK